MYDLIAKMYTFIQNYGNKERAKMHNLIENYGDKMFCECSYLFADCAC